MKAQILVELVDAIDFFMHAPGANLDRNVATSAVYFLEDILISVCVCENTNVARYRFLKPSLDFMNGILPITQQVVQMQEEPAQSFFIHARSVKLGIFVEMREQQVCNYVIGDLCRLCEEDDDSNTFVASICASTASPATHSESVSIDCMVSVKRYMKDRTF